MNLKATMPYLVGVGAAGLVLYWLIKVQGAGGEGFNFKILTGRDGLYNFATENADMALGYTGNVSLRSDLSDLQW